MHCRVEAELRNLKYEIENAKWICDTVTQVRLAIIIWTFSQEMLGSNLGRDTYYPD
jgi:hypothetical protein